MISIGNEIVLSGLKECVNDLDYPVKNKIERAIKKIEKRINSQKFSKESDNTLESKSNLEINTNDVVNFDNNNDNTEIKDLIEEDEDDPFDLLDQIKNS